jgi:hypothetical protein
MTKSCSLCAFVFSLNSSSAPVPDKPTGVSFGQEEAI